MGALAPGTVVIIKKYRESPEFWDSNGEMMTYCGRIMTISHDTNCGNYAMVEDEGRWIWRYIDFLVLRTHDKVNPNLSFKFYRRKKQK